MKPHCTLTNLNFGENPVLNHTCARTSQLDIPGQKSGDRCDDTQQVEERISQQPLHGPVGVGGRETGRTGGIIAQCHSEEEGHTEANRHPVHPRLSNNSRVKQEQLIGFSFIHYSHFILSCLLKLKLKVHFGYCVYTTKCMCGVRNTIFVIKTEL